MEARPAAPGPSHDIERGYKRLHLDHVLQADEGCDLDFLTPPPSGSAPI